jgi:pyridoxal phosphate enzyme (YggS family)
LITPARDNLDAVLTRIEKVARRAGRNPKDIILVGVTKTVALERVLPFLEAGLEHIGENRVQGALAKYQNPDGTRRVDAQLHLIGQLQSNKAKKAVAFFDMIQSVDRLDLADDLDRHAAALGRKVACLVEVKISPEAAKSGVAPEALKAFLAQLRQRSSLCVRGLMGIAPLTQTAEESRPFYAKLRRLFDQTDLDVLSMGMSSDFEIAIEEGSTMVRIGTALFGPRV